MTLGRYLCEEAGIMNDATKHEATPPPLFALGQVVVHKTTNIPKMVVVEKHWLENRHAYKLRWFAGGVPTMQMFYEEEIKPIDADVPF